MNYKNIYEQLVLHRLANPLPNGVYGEKHHIIPTAEGGKDDASNKVKFTAREHYIAHLLLAKIYNDCVMHCAVACFKMSTTSMNRKFRFNSRLFEALKVKRSKFMSQKLKGNKNGLGYKLTKLQLANRQAYYKQYGHPSKGTHRSDLTKRKISESCKGHPYNGGGCCEAGLKWWNNGKVNVRKRECPDGFVAGRLKKKSSDN